MAQEIEIKVKLSEEDLASLKDWLGKNAEFIREENHEEYYFERPEEPFIFDRDGVRDASKYLRVRITDKGASMCYKDWHEDPDRPGYHTHCDEYEFGVSDGKEAKTLCEQLGYQVSGEVIKNRKKFKTEKFEIVIDTLKDLGTFVEIELNYEVDDPKVGLKEILEFLKALYIKSAVSYSRGYVSMIWNPEIDFGEEIDLG